MESKNNISIIVPVYKVEKYLRRCVNSILAQSFSDWILILVDDGSPDNCPVICDEYAKQDSRIHVIHKTNGGLSSARNSGLDCVKTKYLMFVDSDDFLHPDALLDSFNLAERYQADLVQFNYIRGNESIFPTISKSHKCLEFDNRSIFYSKTQNIILPAKLYRSSLWKDVRMPEGLVNEDDATTWKLYNKSRKIICVNTAYYYYYSNPDSIMANIFKTVRLDFIEGYLERIGFFEQQQDKLMVDLSKWRFCLPLMINYAMGNVKTQDLSVLLSYFKMNVSAAVSCSKVPIVHRIILSLFRICPKVYRRLFILIGRAHNL